MAYSQKKRTTTTTIITNNARQPYTFHTNLDSSKTKIRIQAKNRNTKDAFYGEYSSEALRKIGFHQHIKGSITLACTETTLNVLENPQQSTVTCHTGFYTRLKSAIDGKSPTELRAYYWFYSDDGKPAGEQHTKSHKSHPSSKLDCMALILEETSKYDDESSKWCITMKQVAIKDTVKLQEKLEDVVDAVDHRERKQNEKMNFIVQQVKQKFQGEKEARGELEVRVQACESAIKKIGKLVREMQAQISEGLEKVCSIHSLLV